MRGPAPEVKNVKNGPKETWTSSMVINEFSGIVGLAYAFTEV
jgi:hypothetical protein